MPFYDFCCVSCGHIFGELYLSVGEYENSDKMLTCPKCNHKGTHNKLFGAPALKFNGSGWTEKRKSNSTSSIKDKTAEIHDELKNTKSSDVYNTTMPKDIK